MLHHPLTLVSVTSCASDLERSRTFILVKAFHSGCDCHHPGSGMTAELLPPPDYRRAKPLF
jgi:hypothetical protein